MKKVGSWEIEEFRAMIATKVKYQQSVKLMASDVEELLNKIEELETNLQIEINYPRSTRIRNKL